MLEKYAERYLNEKYALNFLSDTTINARRYELKRFSKFCTENKIDSPEKINEDLVIDYLSYLKAFKNINKLTQLNVLNIISAFMEYLSKKNIIPENYAMAIDKPRYVYPDADYLTFDEVKILFNAEKNLATFSTVARNLLLLNMFFTLCLRSCEVVGLKISDLKLELKQIWIRRKGDMIVRFPLNDEIVEQFEDWFKIRKSYAGSNEEWVFISSRGNKLTTRQARYVVSNAMKRAGIIKRKNGPHILRHSGATFRLKNGENIRVIQKMLGHNNISSTEKYLHFNEDDVKDMIDGSPRVII